MSVPILRVTRAGADLERLAAQYREGPGLAEPGRFMDHAGFDHRHAGAEGGRVTRQHVAWRA